MLKLLFLLEAAFTLVLPRKPPSTSEMRALLGCAQCKRPVLEDALSLGIELCALADKKIKTMREQRDSREFQEGFTQLTGHSFAETQCTALEGALYSKPEHQFLGPDVRRTSGGDPPYPDSARRDGVEGSVRTRICVRPTGAVESVDFLSKPGSLEGAFYSSVDATVRTWKYAPLIVQGRPIPFCHLARFVFKLR